MTKTRAWCGSWVRAAALAALAGLAHAVPTHAGQDGAPPAAASARAPGDAWATIRAAYAAAPTAERVTVTVLGGDGSSKGAESFEVRLDPRPGNAAGPRLRLDLGPIRLTAGDGRVAAAHVLSREGAFVAENLATPPTVASLAALLPPLPLPALAALTGGEAPGDAFGYVRDAEWSHIEADPPTGGAANLVGTSGPGAGGAGFTLVGRASGAGVRLRAGASGRIQSLAISDLPNGGSITAEFTPLPAPAMSEFELGVQSWPRVATIRDLFALPPTPIVPGESIPEMSVHTPRGETILLRDALAKVEPAKVTRPDGTTDIEQDPPPAERIVLIIHRLPADPGACEASAPTLAAGRAALAQLLATSERDRFLKRAVLSRGGDPAPNALAALAGAVVLVADLGEGNPTERLTRGERALAGPALPTKYAAFAPRTFHSVAAVASIAPFVKDTAAGDTLAVTVTSDWKLIKAELIAAGTTADQAAAMIEARLRGP